MPRILVILLSIAATWSTFTEAVQVVQKLQLQSRQTPTSSPQIDEDVDEVVQSAVEDANGVAEQQTTTAPTFEVKASAAKAQDDNDSAEGDADDDAEDDDDNEQAPPAKTAPAKKLDSIEQELAANLKHQKTLKGRLSHFADTDASDAEIDEASKLIANETESEAMGDTLGQMWKEMRMFEVPQYEKYAGKQLQALEKDQKELEANLTAEHEKMNSALKTSATAGTGLASGDGKESAKTDIASTANSSPQKAFKWDLLHWDVHHTTTVFGSLVYLIGGVLAAVLFNKVRANKAWLHKDPDVAPSTEDFSIPVFSCVGGGLKLNLLGFCCPCLLWANTMDRKGLLSYWKAFCAFFLLMVLYAYPFTGGVSFLLVAIMGTFFRQKLRDSFNIERSTKTAVLDFVLWCFCQPCVIIQEAREEGVVKRDVV